MLARGQPEGVGMGMAEEVEVVAVQPLHGREEGAALLAGAGEGYGGAGQVVGQGGVARGAVPGEWPPRGRLEHALGGTVDVPGALGPRMHRVGKVRLREGAQGGEERLSNEACFGLEKGQDAGILGVFGLHPLHRRQVVDQVLHALVVAIVEVIGKLGEQLCGKGKGRESSSSGSGRERSGESRPTPRVTGRRPREVAPAHLPFSRPRGKSAECRARRYCTVISRISAFSSFPELCNGQGRWASPLP